MMDKAPIETTIDEFLPHIAKMLETAEQEKVHIPAGKLSLTTNVRYKFIQQ